MPVVLQPPTPPPITLYSFEELIALEAANELSGKIVDKVRDGLQEDQTNWDWQEYVVEMWVKALAKVGFEEAEIQFTGFGCQGDGASFTAAPDLPKLIDFVTSTWPTEIASYDDDDPRPWVCEKLCWKGGEKKFLQLLDWRKKRGMELDVFCKRSCSRYSHEHTCSFSTELNYDFFKREVDQKRCYALIDEFEKHVEYLRLNLCQEIYSTLEQEHEYITSDEALVQVSNDHENLYDLNGRLHSIEDYTQVTEPKPEKPAAEDRREGLLTRLQQRRRLVREQPTDGE